MFLSFHKKASELEAEHPSYAPPVAFGDSIGISKATDVLDVEKFEDVVDAGIHFYIRRRRIHNSALKAIASVGFEVPGEVVQSAVAGVFRKEGIILVRQRAPENIAADVFAPLQMP